MPFFGRCRQQNNSTSNVRPAIYNSSPPPPYQYEYSQQPAAAYQTFAIPSSATNYALASTNYHPPHPPHQRHQSEPYPAPTYTSCTNLVPAASPCSMFNETAEYWNSIGDKFSDVISLIDEEVFPSQREVIFTFDPNTYPPPSSPPQAVAYLSEQHSGMSNSNRSLIKLSPAKAPRPKKSNAQTQPTRINVISKVSLYANSRLPPSLQQPLRLYTPTYPIICLAAQYSNTAYSTPCSLSRSERTSFVAADSRLGTKAMILKSVPIDDMNTIVFAIRGTSLLSPRDWGVNWHTDPEAPTSFLDDEGNLCHRGFLKVARAMVKPIATRLRALLEENPSRAACSLVITGHSAGGAVAALLYAHMMATSPSARSELNILTGCFKRVHCVTFGAPPISLLPLSKPNERRLQKSIFLSFVNEGDPVVRAEKAYVLSLVQLLAAPSPRKDTTVWRVPQGTLCCAGRIVVLRVPKGKEEDVQAGVVTDEMLRGVVWGDMPAHAMSVYAGRVERLAIRRVTGKG